jgi:tryptophanyl-tRNA synthetase
MATRRILTGVRPTGPLHLGHKVGALDNWVLLQNEGKYECFFLVADVQALTTHASKPELIKQAIRDVVLDWLAVGLNPELPRVNFVLQSSVLERYELSILLQMITPWSWTALNPTVKAEMQTLDNEMVVGFPSYPVDQAADILMVAPIPSLKGNRLLVPVGEDQAPHVELTRRIARRFNNIYGHSVLPECEGLIGDIGRLVGIDGNEKMSKSLNNAIFLSDSEEVLREKVNQMYTDPNKIHSSDLGNVQDHVPFKYLRMFYPNAEEVIELQKKYEMGKLGDVPIKHLLFDTLNGVLAPIREHRQVIENTIDICEMLCDGTQKTKSLAKEVVGAVRNAMHLHNLGG